jgi:hypothetical protein
VKGRCIDLQGKNGLPQEKAQTNSLGEVVLPLAAVAVASMIKKVFEAASSTTVEKQTEISSGSDIQENKELVEKAKIGEEVDRTPPTVIVTTEGKMVMGTHGGVLIRAVSNRKREM